MGTLSHTGRMDDYRAELLDLANQVKEKTGYELTTLGHRVANHGHFFERLANGGKCSVDLYMSAKRYLEAQLTDSHTGAV